MVVTQVLAYYFLVLPVYDLFRMPPTLDKVGIILLGLATILTAAGGNIQNDFYDVDADKINKPGKNKVGQDISPESAERAAWILMIAGVLVGFGLALWLGAWKLGLAFFLPPVLLWLYNRSLKGMAVVGNLLVSFLVAYVLLTLGFASSVGLNLTDGLGSQMLGYIWSGVGAYAVFAFIATWIREVIKDIQDMQGDRKVGHKTLPILIGERTSKLVAIILMLLLFRLILMAQQWYLVIPEFDLPLALAIGTELPLIVCGVLVWRANTPKACKLAGNVMKGLMLAGVLSMIFYELLL